MESSHPPITSKPSNRLERQALQRSLPPKKQAPPPSSPAPPSANTPAITNRCGARWSTEEDLLLRATVLAGNTDWYSMLDLFSGRTARSLKDRWTKLQSDAKKLDAQKKREESLIAPTPTLSSGSDNKRMRPDETSNAIYRQSPSPGPPLAPKTSLSPDNSLSPEHTLTYSPSLSDLELLHYSSRIVPQLPLFTPHDLSNAPATSSQSGGKQIGNTTWSEEEHLRLIQLKEYPGLLWKDVAAYFPGRSVVAVQQRWNQVCSKSVSTQNQARTQTQTTPDLTSHDNIRSGAPPSAKRQRWTYEEDSQISRMIESNIGTHEMAKAFPCRTPAAVGARVCTLRARTKCLSSSSPAVEVPQHLGYPTPPTSASSSSTTFANNIDPRLWWSTDEASFPPPISTPLQFPNFPAFNYQMYPPGENLGHE